MVDITTPGNFKTKSLPPLPSYCEPDPKECDAVEAVEIGPKPKSFWSYTGKLGLACIPKSFPLYPTERPHGQDPKIEWKPATLRAPILGPFIVVSVLLIALLEVLAHQSSGSNDGGLAFGYTIDDLPTGSIFSFQYLPTIISVCYSMIWGWVDLDAKRLEPWFQLSKAGGASAEHSLLLQYPFDFLAFVPIRAAKRKHWSVFNAGLAMMMIFWVITPLQSAIFSTGQVSRSRQVIMGTTATLTHLEAQVNSLSGNFLNTAYGVLWLSQKLPSFTTDTYLLLPFELVGDNLGSLPEETWSSNTTAYTTNLTCVSANTTVTDDFTYIFSDGNGCTTSTIELPSARAINASYMILYSGYYPDFKGADSAVYLQSPNCTQENAHKFLALWGSAASEDDNIIYHNLTALFCTPSYYTQTIYATVNATDKSVVSSDFNNSIPQTLSTTDFNVSNFEYLIGTGVSSNHLLSDYPDSVVLQQYPRLLNWSLTSPVSNMVGFAFGTGPTSADALFNPTILRQTFERAHQILFSMAINVLMTPSPPNHEVRPSIQLDQPGAIIFVRPFSIVVEAALGIVVILCCFLWYISYRRQSLMTTDPASISQIMSIMVDNQEILNEFKNIGAVTGKHLEERISHQAFQLKTLRKTGGAKERLQITHTSEVAPRQPDLRMPGDKLIKPVLPTEIGFGIGGILLLVLAAAITVLIYLFWRADAKNGLSLPTSNTVLLSLIENLIPTAFSSMLEPFWVVLNRISCLFQPFEELRQGNAKASSSINAKYTSLPPQLVIWRAFRSKHFLLTAMCGTAILMNVLAVALSGLFQQSQVTITMPQNSSYELSTTFNGVEITNYSNPQVPASYYDHFYVAISNLSSGTSLPKWTDQDRFYLPFKLPKSGQSSRPAVRFQGLTRAFETSVICTPLIPSSNNSVDFSVSTNSTVVNFSTSYVHPNGSIAQCAVSTEQAGPSEFWAVPSPPEDASAFEIMSQLSYVGNINDQAYCQNLIVAGWLRLGPTLSSGTVDASNGTAGRYLGGSFLTCSPTFVSALYNVTVDPDGYVLSATRASQDDDSPPAYSSGGTNKNLLQQTSHLIGPDTTDIVWHNDSLTRDWVNSLLKQRLNTTDLVDPTKAPPNTTALAPTMAALYRSLFATILGLNTHILEAAPDNATLTVTASFIETRLFLSPIMFYIAVALLSLDFVVALWYYARRPKRFLPRMPTSIASLLGYVAAGHMYSVAREGEVDRERRYAYGWFSGPDGKGHVGIDFDEYVVPLHNPGFGAKKRTWGGAGSKYL